MTKLGENIKSSESKQQENPIKETFPKVEVEQLVAELENNPEVVKDAKEQVGKLQKLAGLMGRKTRAVVFAFSMLMANQAKEAMADESKMGADIVNIEKAQKGFKFFTEKMNPVEYKGSDMEVKDLVDKYNDSIKIANNIVNDHINILSSGQNFYKLNTDGSLKITEGTETQVSEHSAEEFKSVLRKLTSKDVKSTLDVLQGGSEINVDEKMILSGIDSAHQLLVDINDAAKTTAQYGEMDHLASR